jgi:hypothetical protein
MYQSGIAALSHVVTTDRAVLLFVNRPSSKRREGTTMKKITVRKAGTVRLTSAAASFYCHGVLAA